MTAPNNPRDDAQQAIDSDNDEQLAQNKATALVNFVLETSVELFHAPDRVAYATIGRAGHPETLAVESKDFRDWLIRTAYETTGEALSSHVINAAARLLTSIAKYDGEEIPVHVRLAEHRECLYLDLADSEHRVVKIQKSAGWSVVPAPPDVKFLRPAGMQALPVPVRGGSLDELRPFLNVSDAEWPLVLGTLLGAFSPEGPYPVQVIAGVQGSAKSTHARVFRSLIDPNVAPLNTLRDDAWSLAIEASNTWVLAYDNVSHIRPAVSDALCRISTGGGFRTRTLYETSAETIFTFQRPVILNGIGDILSRGDLIDRAIFFRLQRIDEATRRTEREFLSDLEKVRPRVLGALLNAVATAYRNVDRIVLEEKPRMADFAQWVVAGEEALPIEEGDFLRAYKTNRKGANELVLEDSPIAQGIMKLISDQGSWEGTATELLDALTPNMNVDQRRRSGWPRSARGMRSGLDRIVPNLAEGDIHVQHVRTKGRRQISIQNATGTTGTSSLLNSNFDDGRGDEQPQQTQTPSPVREQFQTESGRLDGGDGRVQGTDTGVPIQRRRRVSL
ncbi:hypothetical protein FIL92_00530 [SAR202 cluster bacterium AD-812-D07_MRT_10900m]|nr:hypothetical protein [SAR202 cluster bacterium AD-812-D07_MRT_10900m]